MKAPLLLLLSLMVSLLANFSAAAEPATKTPAAIQSSPNAACAFQTPVSYEQKLWLLGPLRLSTAQGKDGTLLPLDQKLILMLESAATQKYVVPPQKTPPKGTFGALVPVRMATSGKYRFSLGQTAWMDLTSRSGERVASVAHEMKKDCNTIRKVVAFPLEGGRDYVLQISGSVSTEIEVLITRQP